MDTPAKIVNGLIEPVPGSFIAWVFCCYCNPIRTGLRKMELFFYRKRLGIAVLNSDWLVCPEVRNFRTLI